jgi:hypothetical protein
MEKLGDSKVKHDGTTHGIVHAGFSGFRRFVARKKSRCKLIGFRFVIPHDTIVCREVEHRQNKVLHAVNKMVQQL